jgi:hypothetical protein
MLAVVPDPWIAESKVTGTGTDGGVPFDASIEVRSSEGLMFTVRTLVRLGECIGSAGLPHGTMTDPISVAALAASSLMLQAIPAGLPRKETMKLMNSAAADSQRLPRDRGGWTFVPLIIADVSYALWHRPHTLGFIAHADLGNQVLAAWGEGDLPTEILRTQLKELP